jgi:carbamoyl-phosphate synthase large subunit
MRVIEINPRFGGGFPLAWEAGARYSTWLIQDVIGRTPDVRTDWKDDLVMLRYDEAVFVDGKDLRA